MIIKFIGKHFKLKVVQEDFRKAGLAFTTAGIGGAFLQHLVRPQLAIWLAILGVALWLCGLFQLNKR